MKINPIPALIAIGISALLAYGFYSFAPQSTHILISVGSFIMLSLSAICAVGVQFNYYRKTVNTRSLSMLFFCTSFISNLIFAFIPCSDFYIIVHGIMLLFYLLLLYFVSRPVNI